MSKEHSQKPKEINDLQHCYVLQMVSRRSFLTRAAEEMASLGIACTSAAPLQSTNW